MRFSTVLVTLSAIAATYALPLVQPDGYSLRPFPTDPDPYPIPTSIESFPAGPFPSDPFPSAPFPSDPYPSRAPYPSHGPYPSAEPFPSDPFPSDPFPTEPPLTGHGAFPTGVPPTSVYSYPDPFPSHYSRRQAPDLGDLEEVIQELAGAIIGEPTPVANSAAAAASASAAASSAAPHLPLSAGPNGLGLSL